MAKTFLDEIVEYPSKALQTISNNKECMALLLNKKLSELTEDDIDTAIDDYMFDYEYVDNTTTETAAYIWVEMDVPRVSNKHIKEAKLYITIACHKQFMKIKSNIISGVGGNRRDNLVRFVDKVLNGNDIFGIGVLALESVKSVSSSNTQFTCREMCYRVSDFNIKDNLNDAGLR